MADEAADVLDLVGDLHEGVADPHAWTRGLDRLSDLMGGGVLALASNRADRPGLDMIGHRIGPATLARLAGPLANPVDNPWAGQIFTAPLRRPITTDDVGGHARLDATRLWSELYQPAGLRHTLGAVLERQPGRAEVCIIARGGEDDYSAAERARFARLLPHLARAWRVRRAVEHWRALAAGMAAVLDRLDRGVIVTGEDGGVRFSNRAAEAMLRAGDGIDAKRGRLRATRPRDTDALGAIIARATRAGIGREAGAAVDAMALPRADARPPLALVAEPLAPAHGERLGQAAEPGAILFLSDSAATSHPAPDRLRLVYGLTATEAELAARMARGDGLAAAARAGGITANTAKTHLKAVFAKVGVTRQAELARRIIADVGGLADEAAHGPAGAPP